MKVRIKKRRKWIRKLKKWIGKWIEKLDQWVYRLGKKIKWLGELNRWIHRQIRWVKIRTDKWKHRRRFGKKEIKAAKKDIKAELRQRSKAETKELITLCVVLYAVVAVIMFAALKSPSSVLNGYEEISLSAEEFLSVLHSAEEITLIREYAFLGKQCYIIVDGKIIGQIKREEFPFLRDFIGQIKGGEFLPLGDFIGQIKEEELPLLGDRFSVRSSNGDLVMYENEEVLHISSQSSVRDSDGNEVGRIESKSRSVPDTVYYKVNDEVVAADSQKWSFFRKDVIEDNDGNILFTMKKNNYFTLQITPGTEDNTKVSPVIAIFMAGGGSFF